MTANVAEVKALKECKDANNNDYVNRYHTEQHALPIANGVMATNLTVLDKTKQYEAADLLLAALKGQTKMSLGRLNAQDYNREPFAVLVVEPESNRVRMLYSPELGLHPLQGRSPIGEKLLWLQGEGSYQDGAPLGMALTCDSVKEETYKAVNTSTIAVSTEAQLSAGSKASNVQTTVTVMRVAPIPVFYALDAIEDSVPAITMLERIQEDTRLDSSPAMVHLHHWLHATFVRETPTKEKMRLSVTEMSAGMTREARAWARHRMEKILGPKPSTPAPQVFAAPAPAPAPQTVTTAVAPKDACPWSDDMLGIIVGMCGFQSVDRAGNIGLIPAWQKAIWKESHTQMKNRKIIDALDSKKKYEEVPTVSNPEVLETIRNAKYFGSDSHTEQSLVEAAKHLSIFSCNMWLDHELEDYRDYEEKKEEATVVTINDVKKTTKKARVPASYLEFLDLLKMYTNTLCACFGDQCPMMKLMQEVIKIIHAYKPAAREQLFTSEHKAHILWIIYLQGREWAKGTAITLQIFTNMMETLKWKKGFVTYTECPKNLYAKALEKKHQKEDLEENTGSPQRVGSPSKAQRKGTSTTRDPRLEVINEAIHKALAVAPEGKTWIPIGAICNMCNHWPTDNGQTRSQECALYMLLGKCESKKCKRVHTDMAKDQVKLTLQKFKPFLEEPEAIWKFVK